jgi:hypothetical protein
MIILFTHFMFTYILESLFSLRCPFRSLPLPILLLLLVSVFHLVLDKTSPGGFACFLLSSSLFCILHVYSY